MRQINIHEAKTHLSRLVEDAARGDEIVIAKAGKPVARLVGIADAPAPRRRGLLKGKIHVADDFDAPLPADVLDDFTLLPGAVTAIKTLNRAGFICPVVTVQTRIAKGLFSEVDFRAWFTAFQDTLARQDARVVGPYLCPHNTTAGCACAKPQATLYRQAIRDYAIDCRRSYVVGDTDADIGAAASLGTTGCLVLTGWGCDQAERIVDKATFVGTDVFTVAQWIVAESERHMPAQ